MSSILNGNSLGFPVSIAPMMDWTDRHYRYIMRLITKRTILYTEMITAEAILRGNPDILLGKEEAGPVVLQLGGDDPEKIYQAAKIAKDYGFDALNLNVGCPSDRVQTGNFGACLMKDPILVSELMAAMDSGGGLPVSIKHRIGIDGKESYQDLLEFVRIVSENSPTNHFIIHARIAILSGLSPKENRTIPPLRYGDVLQISREFPNLKIEINGGIRTREEIWNFLSQGLSGTMIGRAAYENPLLFLGMDEFIDRIEIGEDPSSDIGSGRGQTSPRTIEVESILSERTGSPDGSWAEFLDQLESYTDRQIRKGRKVHHIYRHCMGFFHGYPGSRIFRQTLSDRISKEPENFRLFREALEASRILLPEPVGP
jgi:tRNA-dihydrouridine synthase A